MNRKNTRADLNTPVHHPPNEALTLFRRCSPQMYVYQRLAAFPRVLLTVYSAVIYPLFTLAGIVCACSADAADRPNIILIMPDDK